RSIRRLRPGIKGEREGRLEIKCVEQETALGLGFDCAGVREQSLELIRYTDVMLSREAMSIKAFPCLRARVEQSGNSATIRVPQTRYRSFSAHHRVLAKLISQFQIAEVADPVGDWRHNRIVRRLHHTIT